MKKHFKYPILLTLALILATVGLVFAQPIGPTVQPVPFESNPTASAKLGVTSAGDMSAYDTDLFTMANFYGSGYGTTGYFEVKAFTTSHIISGLPPEFVPGWVDVKIKYQIPGGFTDDSYRIEYTVAPSTTWIPLTPDYAGSDAKFDESTPPNPAIRPFAQIDEPNDNVWDWTDIGNLRVRFFLTRGGYAWDGSTKKVYLFEVWATVYPGPTPPASSTTVSVQPPVVSGVTPFPGATGFGHLFFVDVYVQDAINPQNTSQGVAGFEFTMSYDTSIISYADAFPYWPWIDAVATPDDPAGLLSFVATAEPPMVDVGLIGNSPMARVYFAVDSGGITSLDLIVSKVGAPGGIPIAHNVYGGFFSSPRYMSYQGSLYPGGDPTGTTWHELYPTYCDYWTVTGWTDNTDGDLTASDQIEMQNDATGETKEFHVDKVTITIHWTFKSPDVGEVKAEPESPPEYPDWPIGDPSGTIWHEIYPDYCRVFVITSWEDNGDTVFGVSDQIDFEYFDDPGVTHWAHIDDVTTDILVSEKPPPIPEFPLGLGLMMAIAPAIPIVYLWRTRKKVVAK